ncbi:MAG: aminoglycoside N(3)-acetyltransferase [Chloroflexota bacterium]
MASDRLDESIRQMDKPVTLESLADDLRSIGLRAGDTVIVHASLSSLGWVNGGPVAACHALTEVVTEAGTIVMPAHSYNFSDPANWRSPAVPVQWIDTIRATLPAFDPAIVPTTRMGQIAETFRRWPGATRSQHPVNSFAAWGSHSGFVTENQTYERSQGEHSPLARIYDVDGKVLLLGVGYERNTSFHLAEHRVNGTPVQRVNVLTARPGHESDERWREVEEIQHMGSDMLLAIGTEFEATGAVTVGRAGMAQARLFSQRAAVDHAVARHKRHYRE